MRNLPTRKCELQWGGSATGALSHEGGGGATGAPSHERGQEQELHRERGSGQRHPEPQVGPKLRAALSCPEPQQSRGVSCGRPELRQLWPPQAPPRQPGAGRSAGPCTWGGRLGLRLKATPICEKCLQIEQMPVNSTITGFRYSLVTLLRMARIFAAKKKVSLIVQCTLWL